MEDAAILDRYGRSELFFTLGDVFRKINTEESRSTAIGALALADLIVQTIDERNFHALMLIPEISMWEAFIANDPAEKKEKVQAAVDEAREVTDLMVVREHPLTFLSQILLGTMLLNQFNMDMEALPAVRAAESNKKK